LEVKDKLTSKLIQAIVMIKLEVRNAAIIEFLRCSQRVHTIAFMQWRNKFDNPKLKKIEEQLKEAIS
jgi:hypothetical protein